jgi:hypothetical protein
MRTCTRSRAPPVDEAIFDVLSGSAGTFRWDADAPDGSELFDGLFTDRRGSRILGPSAMGPLAIAVATARCLWHFTTADLVEATELVAGVTRSR